MRGSHICIEGNSLYVNYGTTDKKSGGSRFESWQGRYLEGKSLENGAKKTIIFLSCAIRVQIGCTQCKLCTKTKEIVGGFPTKSNSIDVISYYGHCVQTPFNTMN